VLWNTDHSSLLEVLGPLALTLSTTDACSTRPSNPRPCIPRWQSAAQRLEENDTVTSHDEGSTEQLVTGPYWLHAALKSTSSWGTNWALALAWSAEKLFVITTFRPAVGIGSSIDFTKSQIKGFPVKGVACSLSAHLHQHGRSKIR